MKFEIEITTEVSRGLKPRVRKYTAAIFKELLREKELSFLREAKIISLGIALVGEKKSRSLNLRYRGKDHRANVLSFPHFSATKKIKKAAQGTSVELGDIVITPAVVRREALQSGNSFYSQFFWMLVHGILHILGYDHEGSIGRRKAMQVLENKLLRLRKASVT